MLPGLDLAVELIQAWQRGSRRARMVIFVASVIGAIGGALVLLAEGRIIPYQIPFVVGVILLAVAVIAVATVVALQRTLKQEQAEVRVQQVEQRFRENPTEPQAAWDLARVKLETYLDRNLNQVRSIFWLTVAVMAVGFSLIFYGVVRVFDQPEALKPAIIAACSGILVNLIGATFLIIYRATMAQAREYVTILERINAVGMAVQIIEGIDPAAGDMRPKATAELARQLLSMYKVAATKHKER